jgi:CBS domain-containing protein
LGTLDFKNFIVNTHPFELLSQDDLEKVVETVDITYYKEGEKIIAKNTLPPEYFFIIAKGVVKETDENEEEHFYSARDCFDIKTVLNKNSKSDFIVIEECICFAIRKDIFLELTAGNKEFADYFVQDISSRINSLLNKGTTQNLASFMIATIEDGYIHPAIFIDEDSSIYEAVKKMSDSNSTSIFINYKDGSVGVVTDSNLRNRVILKQKDYSEKIGEIATKGLITVEYNDFLYNALLLMIEHSIKRLVVTRDKEIIGVMEQIDLLSALSHKSYLIDIKIKKAKNLDDIKNAIKDVSHLITSLQNRGVKVRNITKLVNQLNTKVYKKIYELIFPQEIIDNSCLIVLGSEGRKEQTLKTDQDNALILKDEFIYDDIFKYATSFTDALIECGFPRCKGEIMVCNPFWTKSLQKHKTDFFHMLDNPSNENLMNLAILFDANYVGGDKELFNSLRNIMFSAMQANPAMLSHFARATLMFETPLTMFANFILGKKEHKDELDIKKGAIFAIVHGIRSLALQHRLEMTNTTERIVELTNIGVITKELSNELLEGFNFLLTLRLKIQLEKEKKNLEIDNYVKPKQLTKLERDLLVDVLKLVDNFKKFISHHFKLNMVS